MSRRCRRARQLFQRDAEDEYRRLLYVAMTRAADRLIVCGAEGVRGRPPSCWYDLVRKPLAELLVEEQDDGETGLALSQVRKRRSRASPRRVEPEVKSERPALPRWLRELAPAEPPRAVVAVAIVGIRRRRAPRRARAALSRRADRQKALRSRPPRAPADAVAARHSRRSAASRPPRDYLGKRGEQLRRGRANKALGQHPRPSSTIRLCRTLCAGQPRRSADRRPHCVAGQHRRFTCPGQIDRLAVTDKAVLIADYKTDRSVPPETSSEVAVLRHPACALSRGAGAALSGQDRSRGAVVHRRPDADGTSGSRRWMPPLAKF